MTLVPRNVLDMFKDLDKFYVGFDDNWNRMAKLHDDLTKNIPNYPPYNIRKVEDNKYVIEMAVAGFGEDEVSVQIEDGTLVVKGEKTDKSEVNYVYRGIGTRSFTKSIRLNDTIEVRGAQFKDGILKIGLENIIPEHKKPRKIEFSKEINFTQPKLLQEVA